MHFPSAEQVFSLHPPVVFLTQSKTFDMSEYTPGELGWAQAEKGIIQLGNNGMPNEYG